MANEPTPPTEQLRTRLLPLLKSRPKTVPGVRQRLARIQAEIVSDATADRVTAPAAADAPEDSDGIGCFNYLYHDITSRVYDQLQAGGFGDKAFLERLDLRFAWRYLDALQAWLSEPETAPQSWALLFDRRGETSITRLQFAMAGINAHVNYDLAFALVSALEDLGRSDLDEGCQRKDYDAVNEIFYAAIPALKWHFEGRWLRLFDRMDGGLDDLAGSLAVLMARSSAWDVAERLWAIRKDAGKLERMRRELDEVVAQVGRGLLL
jgi:hypothetical protein